MTEAAAAPAITGFHHFSRTVSDVAASSSYLLPRYKRPIVKIATPGPAPTRFTNLARYAPSIPPPTMIMGIRWCYDTTK